MSSHPFFELFRYELEAGLRTKRLILLFILVQLLVVGGGACVVELSAIAERKAVESFENPAQAELTMAMFQDTFRQGVVTAIAEVHGLEAELVRPALTRHFLLPLMLVFALLGIPWLVGLVAFDVVSGEIGRRSLRYTIVRAHVGWWLAARLSALSLILVTALMTALSMVLWIYSVRMDAPWLLESIWPLTLVSLLLGAWAALHLVMAALISSLFRSGMFSLFSWITLLMGLALLNTELMFGGRFRPLTPAWWQSGLWSSSASDLISTLAVWGGFAALFFIATIVVLRRREL